MAKPILERNGESEVQETIQEATVEKTVTPVSPVTVTASPVKQVVFRSVDANLKLYQNAATIDKSQGIPTHVRSTGVEFKEHFKYFDDTPENAFVIKWTREHEMNGVRFFEVPDISNMTELPTIQQMKEMSISELKELCVKYVVTISDNDKENKAAIILALMEKI
jgi:hypothetical protein